MKDQYCFNGERHQPGQIYVPRLRSGRLVNPDPAPALGPVLWRGDFVPSPFGNHTKGELTEPHATPTPAIYLAAPADLYDDDGDFLDTSEDIEPPRAASDLPSYRFPIGRQAA